MMTDLDANRCTHQITRDGRPPSACSQCLGVVVERSLPAAAPILDAAARARIFDVVYRAAERLEPEVAQRRRRPGRPPADQGSITREQARARVLADRAIAQEEAVRSRRTFAQEEAVRSRRTFASVGDLPIEESVSTPNVALAATCRSRWATRIENARPSPDARTLAEVADETGASRQNVELHARTGKLRATRSKGMYWVSREDLAAWLEARPALDGRRRAEPETTPAETGWTVKQWRRDRAVKS